MSVDQIRLSFLNNMLLHNDVLDQIPWLYIKLDYMKLVDIMIYLILSTEYVKL